MGINKNLTNLFIATLCIILLGMLVASLMVVNNVEATKTANIKTDKTAPTGTVIINGGAIYTNSESVTLNLTASDDTSQIWQMCFSNDGMNFTDWEPYNFTKSYVLPGGDGTKTVYIKVKNMENVSSDVMMDTIILDTTPPETHIIFIGETYMGVYVTNVQLELYTITDHSGINTTYYYLNDDDGWVAYTNPFLLTENQTYILKYYSIDNIGNTEEIQTQTFKINISFAQPDINISEPWNTIVKGNYMINWNMSSPIGEHLSVTNIVLQAENGEIVAVAEHLLNITNYNIDTNTIPNNKFYIKIVVRDTYGRTTNGTTLTTVNINNPYIQQTWLGKQSLLTCENVTEGSVSIIAEVTNRKSNQTFLTTEIYINGIYEGRTQKTLLSMGKQNMTVPIVLASGEQWIQVKLFDGNTLIETITKCVTVTPVVGLDITSDESTTTPEQKGEKKFPIDSWIIGIIITVLVLALLIIGGKIIKKHLGERKTFNSVITKNQPKNDDKTELNKIDEEISQGKTNMLNTGKEGWE